MKTFIILGMVFVICFCGCGSKKPSQDIIPATANGVDFGIGDTPMIPAESGISANEMIENPKLFAGPNIKEEAIKEFLKQTTTSLDNHSRNSQKPSNANNANSSRSRNLDTSDVVTLLSGGGIALTVWATNPGNWLWGYPPFNSIEFGKARQWRILTRSNGKISFQNVQTGTCMSAYKNGVIHLPCRENNPSQLWNINPFSNRAIQLQNEATKTCLQTPVIRTKNFGSIFLAKCVTQQNPSSGNDNISQQWVITAPLTSTPPIFVID